MQITLVQFERIDHLHGLLMRIGNFETCADPRGYITISNRLLDACVDAIGYEAACAYASAEECAADLTAKALLSADFVEDINACDCGATIEGSAMLCGHCAHEYRAELAVADDF